MPQTNAEKQNTSVRRRANAYHLMQLIAQSQGVPTPKPRDVASGKKFDEWLASVIKKFNDEIETMK